MDTRTTTDAATTYILRDMDSGVTRKISATSLDDARKQAHNWACEGYERVTETVWVDTRIEEPDCERGDYIEFITTAIDPEEPDCSCSDNDCEHDGETHRWGAPHEIVGGCRENPGVYGHGGGVIITEVCMCCGTTRVTDTWAQRPDTGEQGLESLSYERGKYADEVRALRDGEAA